MRSAQHRIRTRARYSGVAAGVVAASLAAGLCVHWVVIALVALQALEVLP